LISRGNDYASCRSTKSGALGRQIVAILVVLVFSIPQFAFRNPQFDILVGAGPRACPGFWATTNREMRKANGERRITKLRKAKGELRNMEVPNLFNSAIRISQSAIRYPCRGRPPCLPCFWATTGGCPYNFSIPNSPLSNAVNEVGQRLLTSSPLCVIICKRTYPWIEGQVKNHGLHGLDR
jgi:hypothetical protein